MTPIELAQWRAAKENEPFWLLLRELEDKFARDNCKAATAETVLWAVAYRDGYRNCIADILGLEAEEEAPHGPRTKERPNR